MRIGPNHRGAATFSAESDARPRHIRGFGVLVRGCGEEGSGGTSLSALKVAWTFPSRSVLCLDW